MADTPDMPFPPEPGEAVTHPRPGRGRGLLRLLLMLIAALGGLALSSTHAHAAETTNYGIRPAQSADHFQLELAPGAAALDTAIVSNRSGKEMTFKVYAADALTTDQGGFALRARDEPQSGVGQWVKLPVDTVTISAGAQQEVPFRLSLPADASPGDYAGGLILEAPPREGTPGEVANQTAVQLNVVERVGVRLYLKVSGTARAELTTGRLSTTDENGAIGFTLPITNTGNVILKPAVAGTVRARVGGNHEVTFRQVESLLPGQTATVRGTWQDPPNVLWGSLEAVVQHEGGTAGAQADLRRVPWIPAVIIAVTSLLVLWTILRGVRTVRQARRMLRQPPVPRGAAPSSDPVPVQGGRTPLAAGRGRHRRV